MKLSPSPQFLRDVLVNFLGAVLGIIVTFGTTAYLDNRAKEQRYERLIFTTLRDIEQSVNQLDSQVQNCARRDTIFRRVISLYPDHLHETTSDTLNLFINELSSRNFYSLGSVAQNIFKTSRTSLDDIDNPMLLHTIDELIKGTEIINNMLTIQEEQRITLFNEFCRKKHFSEYGNAVSAVKSALDIPEIYNLAIPSGQMTVALGPWFINTMRELLDICWQRSGISEKRLQKLREEFQAEGWEPQENSISVS